MCCRWLRHCWEARELCSQNGSILRKIVQRLGERIGEREREKYIIEPLISNRLLLFTLKMMRWLDSEKRSYIFNLCTLNELCTNHTTPRQIRSIHCTQFNLHEVQHVICIHTHVNRKLLDAPHPKWHWMVCSFSICPWERAKSATSGAPDRTSARTSKTNTRTQHIFRFKIDVDTIINPDDEKCGFPNVNYYDSRNESTTQRNKQMEMAKWKGRTWQWQQQPQPQ